MSISELYAILTLQLGYPPSYVLDEMQMYEVRAVMNHQHFAHKDSWEQARLVAYIVAQCNSTKKLKLQDISTFYWEEPEEDDTYISTSDLQRLKDKAKQYLTKMETENGY